MQGRTKRLLAFAIGLAGLLPRDASAYVRELTSAGVPVAWLNPCVDMHFSLGSPPPVLAASDLKVASTLAAAAWSYPQVAGTDIRLAIATDPQASARVGYDKRNVITFRQGTWCRDPPRIDDAGVSTPDCYPSSALAVTSIFKNVTTGEIVDADIEFNAVYFAWGDLVTQPGLATPLTADFQNALTHELGHVIGLDHNCFTENDGQPWGNDNTGSPEVDCYNPTPPDAVAQATMYPSVLLTDVERRTLSPDDELGASEIYPHLHDVCPSRPSDGGCSVTAAGATSSHWPELSFVALALFLSGLALRPRREKS